MGENRNIECRQHPFRKVNDFFQPGWVNVFRATV